MFSGALVYRSELFVRIVITEGGSMIAKRIRLQNNGRQVAVLTVGTRGCDYCNQQQGQDGK